MKEKEGALGKLLLVHICVCVCEPNDTFKLSQDKWAKWKTGV